VYDNVANTPDQKQHLAALNNRLYQDKLKKLGLKTQNNESVDQTQMRVEILEFLANKGKNKNVRSYFVDMAKAYTGYGTDNQLHPDAADSNTIASALNVAAKELGVPFAKHLTTLLDKETDGTIRGRLLGGIAAVDDLEYAEEIREWILSDRLRDNEIYAIAFGHLGNEKLKYPMWEWFKDNFTDVKSRVSSFAQNRLPRIAAGFCSEGDYDSVNKFFAPEIENVSGGPRSLAQTLEAIELCQSQASHHRKDVLEFLDKL